MFLLCNNRQGLSKEDLERVIEACDMVQLINSFYSSCAAEHSHFYMSFQCHKACDKLNYVV